MSCRFSWAPGVLSLVLLVGCSKPSATISGDVKFEQKPVTAGSVNFLYLDRDGIGQSADLDDSGNFKMPGPMPPGKYKVFLSPPVPVAQKEPPKDFAKLLKTNYPKKYLDMKTSDLIVEITAGDNRVPITLTD